MAKSHGLKPKMVKESENYSRPESELNKKYSEFAQSKWLCWFHNILYLESKPQEVLTQEPQTLKVKDYEGLIEENQRDISKDKQKSADVERYGRQIHPKYSQEELDPRQLKYADISYQQK